MKVNIITDGDGRIVSWTDFPFDESKPYAEVEDPRGIRLGCDRLADGEIVKDDEAYAAKRARQTASVRIRELKERLAETDYKVIKHAEGSLPDDEFEAIKAERRSWREEINRLEESLK